PTRGGVAGRRDEISASDSGITAQRMGMSATTGSRPASGEQSGGLLRGAMRALTPGRVALLLLALAAIYRLVLLARGWPALDSDEAVIGLMARHILHGERPTFFWGQNYMGPFEAY